MGRKAFARLRQQIERRMQIDLSIGDVDVAKEGGEHRQFRQGILTIAIKLRERMGSEGMAIIPPAELSP